MDSNSLKSAGEILKALLNEKQSEQAREYYRFFSAWDEIVGENLAGRARAKELKGKTLIVEVDHPGWIQLLEMRRARILHELNERFPDLQIEKIRFYVSGEQAQEDSRKTKAPEAPGPGGVDSPGTSEPDGPKSNRTDVSPSGAPDTPGTSKPDAPKSKAPGTPGPGHPPKAPGTPGPGHPAKESSADKPPLGTPGHQASGAPDSKGKKAEDTRDQPESKAKLDSVLRRLGNHIKDNGKAGGKNTGKDTGK